MCLRLFASSRVQSNIWSELTGDVDIKSYVKMDVAATVTVAVDEGVDDSVSMMVIRSP